MKYINRTITVILVFLLIQSFFPLGTVYAFDRKEHDRYMNDVLFKAFKSIEIDNNRTKECVKALSCASYLTIDQYNNRGTDDLEYLKQYGVKDLPVSIREIDFSANYDHRKCTHRGWSAENTGVYNTSDNVRWIIRKKILLNTTDKIFDFKGDKSKQDSFCALVYYVHVLGDRIADDKYYPNAVIMELGGRKDDADITHELLHHISILFSDQKSTHKYNHVMSKLESCNSKISKLVNKKGGLSEEDFILYQKYANEIMEILVCNIPEMLKEEDFFKEIFY